jgi:hypothetical protein
MVLRWEESAVAAPNIAQRLDDHAAFSSRALVYPIVRCLYTGHYTGMLLNNYADLRRVSSRKLKCMTSSLARSQTL